MEKLLSILKTIRPDVDFLKEKKMIDEGVLDSFDIIQIVMELNDTFDIDIDVDDLEPDNFNSVEAMWALIQQLQNE